LGQRKKLPYETGDLLKEVQFSYEIFYDRKYSNNIHLWSLLTLYQISVFIFSSYIRQVLLYFTKIKFKFSIVIEVQSRGYPVFSPPPIIKCQGSKMK